MPPSTVIGVISDTHGLLRAEAAGALSGVEHIVHAGDIGTPEVLNALSQIAPLTAVRGNNDRGAWADAIGETAEVRIGRHRLLVLHDIAELAIDPAGEGYAAVITGHSHKARIERRDGVLYLNPGSAGPRRFRLPVTLARMQVAPDAITAEIIELSTQ